MCKDNHSVQYIVYSLIRIDILCVWRSGHITEVRSSSFGAVTLHGQKAGCWRLCSGNTEEIQDYDLLIQLVYITKVIVTSVFV